MRKSLDINRYDSAHIHLHHTGVGGSSIVITSGTFGAPTWIVEAQYNEDAGR